MASDIEDLADELKKKLSEDQIDELLQELSDDVHELHERKKDAVASGAFANASSSDRCSCCGQKL